MVHTTPPKEDKVDTSSAEALTAQDWWPDREVRRQMIILLTTILTF
jgi:hypothetical protein